MQTDGRPLVIVSNRGPLSYRRDADGRLVARRGGGGGLVSGLAPLVVGTDTLWIASALSEDDRAAAAGPALVEGFNVELVAHPPDVLRMAYDVVGNAVLWFVHHGLFELARRPRFDQAFRRAWEAFREYNQRFADAVVASAWPRE